MPEDRFTGNVLRCLGRSSEKARNGRMPTGKWTVEEIRDAYLCLHPPNRLQKTTGFIPEVNEFEVALLKLYKLDFVDKEPTWYTDRLLEKETVVYFVTQLGVAVLLSTKSSASRKK